MDVNARKQNTKMTQQEAAELAELKRIGEQFCKVRFVVTKDSKGHDELRIWFTVGPQICNVPMGLLTDPETVQRVRQNLEGHVGAGACGTESAVNQLKTMLNDVKGGCWKMELHSLYIVLTATSVGYRRAWSRHPEGVYEMLEFLRSGDVCKLPRGICWENYPNSVEWTGEKDLP